MGRAEDIVELYRSMLADGHCNAASRGLLSAPTHAADGDNPMCGDHLRVEIRVVDGRVAEAGFAGDCCVVCRASAALMCDLLAGVPSAQVAALSGQLEATLRRDSTAQPAALFGRMLPLRDVPQRHRCAMLPWAAAAAALRGDPFASTEEATA